MKRMSARKFMAIVQQVLDTLPPAISQRIENLLIDVVDEPSEELLREQGYSDEEIADGATLLGLFEELPDTHVGEGNLHRITIYRFPHEDNFPDRRELRREIRKTVIHELAHHFGWSEADLERFESKADPFGDEL